jgi:hypothetical protein
MAKQRRNAALESLDTPVAVAIAAANEGQLREVRQI